MTTSRNICLSMICGEQDRVSKLSGSTEIAPSQAGTKLVQDWRQSELSQLQEKECTLQLTFTIP